jgi:hypothetical protein
MVYLALFILNRDYRCVALNDTVVFIFEKKLTIAKERTTLPPKEKAGRFDALPGYLRGDIGWVG